MNKLLPIVDAIQASSLEVREARSKLLRQIIREMDRVDSIMIEAMDLREMKKKNAQRMLQAVKAQVKTARHIRDNVAQLHAQVNMGWDTQTMQEGYQQDMNRHEKRAIQEVIESRKDLLDAIRMDVRARRDTEMSMESGGNRNGAEHEYVIGQRCLRIRRIAV